MQTENPRYVAARSKYGPGMTNWQFFEFISDAKIFAYRNGMGVEKRRDYLSVVDQELFTVACERYANR